MGQINGLIDLPERHLVRALLMKLDRLYDAFGFVFDNVLPYERNGWTYLFIGEIPRRRLGLDPRLKPGDIDVMIVPSYRGDLRVDLTAAIEVKRLPLRTGLIGRNVDRYGVTQAQGLVRDGFPLVGILHVIVSAPGAPEHTKTVQMMRVVDAEAQRVQPCGEEFADLTGLYAADLQINRLKSRAPDARIGLNAFAMQEIRGSSNGFRPFPSYGRAASMNEAVSQSLLTHIKSLAEEIGPISLKRN